MSSTTDDTILGLPRRPRRLKVRDEFAEDFLVNHYSSILGSAEREKGVDLKPALTEREYLQRQHPLPLKTAIKDYLNSQGLAMALYERSPRSVKVIFRYQSNAYWKIESVLPDDLHLSQTDAEDWLYGDLIANTLPDALQQIQPLTA